MEDKSKKIKVLTLSDHPIHALSGVGTQTRYVIEALLKSEKFSVISLGGAIKHPSYSPQKTEEFGDDWTIYPVNGYGDHETIRSVLRTEKPDILWFMTDPRYFTWLWEIEDEIRACVPMVYYHVWDNYPFPTYNKDYYESNDVIASISKVTHDIVNNVAPEVENHYVPHAVNSDIFKKLEKDQISEFSEDHGYDKFTFFWNNRNARRKQSGSLIWWFKEFLDEVGLDKARLIMHTDPHDMHGQNLKIILQELGLTSGQVLLSNQKIPPEMLNLMYNSADCTINISDAEGFGLATLESLACGTPIIVNMTGGLQEQVTDGEEWFGIGIEPSSKAVIGSQEVPYIYEDRISKQDFIAALHKIYSMSEEEREEMGRKGMAHVEKNYNFANFEKEWVELMESVHEKYGSWENRKNFKNWHLVEIK
jgi:glycosyltransferase involved in cell wall biosynthesis